MIHLYNNNVTTYNYKVMNHYTRTQLEKAIATVNRRYAAGLNDDDQVSRMIEIDRNTKGFSFIPNSDNYSLCTDFDKLKAYAEKYGYWSKEVKAFNEVLSLKGGFTYMDQLNNKYHAISKGLSKEQTV